jgi:hypothetical protein
MTLGRQLQTVWLFLALGMAAAQAQSPAQTPSRATPFVVPVLMEIGQGRDGGVAYIAQGYAPANATVTSLGGAANGDLSFRVGGYCLDSPVVTLAPTGVSGSTTAWSYALSSVSAALVEDAPKGSCKYTVRVSYEISLTGAVTISQMEYTVYLRGHGAPAAGGGLSTMP